LTLVAARRQLYNLSDDMATKIDIQFYQDARDALLKAIVERRLSLTVN
jgi:ATP-dependent Lon protease